MARDATAGQAHRVRVKFSAWCEAREFRRPDAENCDSFDRLFRKIPANNQAPGLRGLLVHMRWRRGEAMNQLILFRGLISDGPALNGFADFCALNAHKFTYYERVTINCDVPEGRFQKGVNQGSFTRPASQAVNGICPGSCVVVIQEESALLVTQLWPFETQVPVLHAGPREETGGVRGGGGARERVMYDTAKHLWSVQQSMSLRKPVASALLQTGLAGMQGFSAPVAANPWVALVLAQQASLDGGFDASLKLSLTAVEAQRVDSPHRQVALACALFGLLHRGLLMACPLALDMPGCDAQTHRRRLYLEAFQPMLAVQRELRGSKPQLPAQLQAQVDRIHVVLDTLAGSEPSDAARLQLLSDLISRKHTSQTGQALLCSGLVYLLRDEGARAAQCFDELAALSKRLAWGFGRWVALYEMCMLDAASRGGMPRSSTEIAAMIGPDFSSWLLASNATAGEAQTKGACARVEKAKAFIRESLGQRFSVADVAAHCEVSAKTLGQDFKDLEGMAPLEYITRQRVMLAEQLLAQRQLSLKAVAQAVGFDSVLGFNKAYARIKGRTPVLPEG